MRQYNDFINRQKIDDDSMAIVDQQVPNPVTRIIKKPELKAVDKRQYKSFGTNDRDFPQVHKDDIKEYNENQDAIKQ